MSNDKGALMIVRSSAAPAAQRPLQARILATLENMRSGERSGRTAASNIMGSNDELKAAAAELLFMRRRRQEILSSRLVGEAAWDILLSAYSSPNSVIQTKELCASSQVPEATAIRWLQVLEREGLLEKAVHPIRQDGRATYYRLSVQGRAKVAHALAAMLQD